MKEYDVMCSNAEFTMEKRVAMWRKKVFIMRKQNCLILLTHSVGH